MEKQMYVNSVNDYKPLAVVQYLTVFEAVVS